MTLPNKLTLLRIILIPAMVVLFYIPYLRDNAIFLNISYANFFGALIFVIASFTDFLDGFIARKYNLVTTFGKFADPLADKMLVVAAMACLMMQKSIFGDGVCPMWVFVIVIIREFVVSGIRLVAVEKGTVIAASKIGKWKTFSTMIALIVLFFFQSSDIVFYIGEGILYVACLLTVLSGIDYFWKNRKSILESV